MAKIEFVPPGHDPTQQEYEPQGPNCRGCLTMMVAVLALIGIAGTIIYLNGNKPSLATVPTIASLPTETHTSPTSTGTVTPRPTHTQTATPSKTQPGVITATQGPYVARWTSTAIPTRLVTKTPRPKPTRKPRPVQRQRGGSGSAPQPAPQEPITAQIGGAVEPPKPQPVSPAQQSNPGSKSVPAPTIAPTDSRHWEPLQAPPTITATLGASVTEVPPTPTEPPTVTLQPTEVPTNVPPATLFVSPTEIAPTVAASTP